MAIEFYNVKKKKKVSIDESKYRYTSKINSGLNRYMHFVLLIEGTNVTELCSEIYCNKFKISLFLFFVFTQLPLFPYSY